MWYEVRDDNGNGLRVAEVKKGVDATLSGPHRLEDSVERVTLGFPPIGSIPKIPPDSGTIAGLEDPIRIGSTDLLTFSPLGTASSGTLYVTDGRMRSTPSFCTARRPGCGSGASTPGDASGRCESRSAPAGLPGDGCFCDRGLSHVHDTEC